MATIKPLNPKDVWQVPEAFQPVYSHATEVTLGQKMVFVSGQFGVSPDGVIPESFGEQATQAMANVENLLSASGMTTRHIVKTNFYLTRATDAPELVRLRTERWSSDTPPAVTVVTVSALARPEYLVEIEAIAIV